MLFFDRATLEVEELTSPVGTRFRENTQCKIDVDCTAALTFRAGRNFNIQPWKVGECSGAKTPSMFRTIWKILVAGTCSVSRQIFASFSKKR